jgi:hypothetical protein
MNDNDDETMRDLVEALREMKALDGVNEIQEEDLREDARNWFEESRPRAEMFVAQFRRLRNEVKQRQISDDLRKGKYYNKIDDVLKIASMECDRGHFNALRRPKDFAKNGSEYVMTRYFEPLKAALRGNTVVKGDDETSRSGNSTNRQTYPVTVFGIDNMKADVAHLVPASSVNAGMYGDVARWLFGLEDKDADGKVIQKLIHGCREEGKTNRMSGTGLKHFTSNKIRLPKQKEYFDTDPCMFIIPVMTLEEVKTWNGGKYPAIFLAGDHSCYDHHPSIHATKVYEETLWDFIDQATEDQIKTACELLKSTVLGLAYSYLYRKKEVLAAASKKSKRAYANLHADNDRSAKDRLEMFVLKRNPNGLTGDGVIVPRLSDDLPDPLRVALIQFCSHDEHDGHPAPDPMLLVIKSAANWSWRHGQKLIATGERPEEEDEMDTMENEAFCAFRDASLKTDPPEELAIRLHQWPGGRVAAN